MSSRQSMNFTAKSFENCTNFAEISCGEPSLFAISSCHVTLKRLSRVKVDIMDEKRIWHLECCLRFHCQISDFFPNVETVTSKSRPEPARAVPFVQICINHGLNATKLCYPLRYSRRHLDLVKNRARHGNPFHDQYYSK